MRTEERTIRWQDTDTYLAAYERKKAERYYRADAPLMASDAPEVPDADPYRQAARATLGRAAEPGAGFSALVSDDPGAVALAVKRVNQDYEEKRRNAQLQVELADKAGVEVPADIRALAETPSAQLQVDQVLARRAKSRKAAAFEANTTPRGHHDGSFVDLHQGDPTGWQLDAERMLASQDQIRRHREMAGRQP